MDRGLDPREEEREVSKRFVDEAVATKTEAYKLKLDEAASEGGARVEAAVGAGKAALRDAVDAVKEQAKIDSDAAARVRQRQHNGLKLFLSTAQSQLAMLGEEDAGPTPTAAAADDDDPAAAPAEADDASTEY